MKTPDYYKYDDGEVRFECFDISRYYSGDWAQVIQYVFRWQKKGGIEDLEKAIACAKDARDNGIFPEPITDNRILYQALRRKFCTLSDSNFSNARNVWDNIGSSVDRTDETIEALEEMIKNAKNAKQQ